jgi:hypothetical protein
MDVLRPERLDAFRNIQSVSPNWSVDDGHGLGVSEILQLLIDEDPDLVLR